MDKRFEVSGRSRRSAALDLKSAAGRDAVLKLVEGADVLIEGFRPGVAERLGLGPEHCHARNPRLVYGRMTGFGQSGPLAQAAGHDINYIALTGALHAIGPAGAKPVPPLNLVGDYGGGALYLAMGLLAALFERQASGRGQVVDAAMVDGAASLASIFFGLKAAGTWSDERGSNLLDGGAPFYDTYECADGKYVSIGALEPKFFAEMAERIGLDARFIRRQYDRKTWPEMRAEMTRILRGKTRDEWSAALEGTDACFAPVLTLDEAPRHAHASARAAFVEVSGVVQPGPAPRFDRSGSRTPRPAPAVGTHTDEVLAEAGFDTAAIAALHAAGVAKGP
jgi:alpha-methylacyl-CoA racemase